MAPRFMSCLNTARGTPHVAIRARTQELTRMASGDS